MITISLFVLLALALTLLVWVAQLLKNIKAQEELVNTLLERVEVKESLLVEKTQQIKALQEAVFETKESFIPWIESLQEESDEWADIAKDREAKIKSLEQEILNNKESSYFLLESYQEDLDVAQDCIWDKSKQISIKMELLNEIAEELFSIGLQDTIRAEDVFKVRELALGQDIPF